MGLFKRSIKSQAGSRRAAKPQPKTFILEPILTPSGLVAGEDPNHPAALVDWVTHPAVDLGMTSTEMHPVVDPTHTDVGSVHSGDVTTLHSPVIDLVTHADIQPLAFVGHPLDSMPSNPASPFTSGVFTVGETGLVSVDYLFDGGGYKGELAFFSLDGMDQLTPGSHDFIQEAAHRALSDSDLGHVVIRDAGEGAKFSAKLSYEGNFNQGGYLGEKIVHMTPGSKFGGMLVPNATVQEVYDNPAIDSNKHPLFSLATANPQHKMQLGQIGDVTGDGHTFALEDQRLDKSSDHDYNDIVFHVKGATGQAETLDAMINHQKDWRQSAIGLQLIEYVTQQDARTEPSLDSGHNPLLEHGQNNSLEQRSHTEPSSALTNSEPSAAGESAVSHEPLLNSEHEITPAEPLGESAQETGVKSPIQLGVNSESLTDLGDHSTHADPSIINDSTVISGTTIYCETLPGNPSGTAFAVPGSTTHCEINTLHTVQPLIGIIDTGFAANDLDLNYADIKLGY